MSKLNDEQEIISVLKKQFGDKILEAEVERIRRIHIKVKDPDQLAVIAFAKEKWQAWHLIAVSSVDKPDGTIAAVYHFDIRPPHAGRTAITMDLMIDCADKKKPMLTSMNEVIPGAVFFEREAHDLMGIVFDKHPDLSKLVLPDDFPDGVYPLRKDFLLAIQKEEEQAKEK